MLTQKEIDFIVENAKADTTKLLLGGKKFQDINLKLCINCIESRRKLAGKLPQWHANTSLVYPFPLSAEQCSSEATGQYKRELMATLLKNKKHNSPTTTATATAAEATETEATAAEATETTETTATATATATATTETTATATATATEATETTATAAATTDAATTASETTTATAATEISGADLTGGMGVDSYYLSGLCKGTGETPDGVFHYFERNGELCEATEYNFKQLGAENIKVHNAELSKENIPQLLPTGLDFIFIDPARRSKSDKSSKVISLDEYEPNLIELQEELFKHAPTILAKVSPMADIKLNLKLLPNTTAVHIVSVDNECKELLFVIESAQESKVDSDCQNQTVNTISQIPITAVNIKTNQPQPAPGFTFTFTQEEQAGVIFATEIGEYLYEPNKSILKGGAFKLLSEKYNLKKLAPSTHLYTSNQAVEDFPGKIFTVEEAIVFNKKSIKQIAAKYPKADISARNFPLDTNALKKMSGIKDGGDKHIFATTLSNGEKMILIARNRN